MGVVDEAGDGAQKRETGRVREARVAGLRLVGVWIPWQAVALVVVVVAALSASITVLVSRPSRQTSVRFHPASADASTTTVAAVDTTAVVPSTTVSPTSTTVEPTAPPTTSRPAPPTSVVTPPSTKPPAAAPTTTVSTTTSTTIPPGSAEVAIFNGVGYGNGSCPSWETKGDWAFVGRCDADPPHGELVFTLDPRRYPARATFRLDVGFRLEPDVTYCLRVVDPDTKVPLGGSEKCWVSRADRGGSPTMDEITEIYGPLTVPSQVSKLTFQVKISRTGDGSYCWYDNTKPICAGQFTMGKVLIEW